MTTKLGSMLAFALEHSKEAYVFGDRLLVVVEIAFPAEGQSGAKIESATTWGELRAILGY
jgi:hypothetical protein